MSDVDKLIQHYAEQIEEITNKGTSAGEITWRGLLNAFLTDYLQTTEE